MPGERRTPVLVRPELAIEVLMRSGRANQLPLADPLQDAFAGTQRIPGLRESIADLEAGERLLLDRGLLDALAAVEADPGSDLLSEPNPGSPTAPLQVQALEAIDDRFRLRTIHRGRDGFVVVQLAARG
jgi:hypothetical protein